MGKDSQNLCVNKESHSRKNKLHFICTQAVSCSQLKLKFLHNLAVLLCSYIWLMFKINMSMSCLWQHRMCMQLQFTAVNTCVYTATPIVRSLHTERASLNEIWCMCVVWKPDNCINAVSLSGSLHHSGLREAEGCWCHSATDREGCCWIQQTSPPGYQSGRSLSLYLLTTLHLPYCTNQDTHLNAFIVVSLFHLYLRK